MNFEIRGKHENTAQRLWREIQEEQEKRKMNLDDDGLCTTGSGKPMTPEEATKKLQNTRIEEIYDEYNMAWFKVESSIEPVVGIPVIVFTRSEIPYCPPPSRPAYGTEVALLKLLSDRERELAAANKMIRRLLNENEEFVSTLQNIEVLLRNAGCMKDCPVGGSTPTPAECVGEAHAEASAILSSYEKRPQMETSLCNNCLLLEAHLTTANEGIQRLSNCIIDLCRAREMCHTVGDKHAGENYECKTMKTGKQDDCNCGWTVALSVKKGEGEKE